MRRAMQQMGEEKVLFGGNEWPRLFELAQDLINWMVKNLDPYVLKDEVGLDRHSPQLGEPKQHGKGLHEQLERDQVGHSAAPTGVADGFEAIDGPIEDARSKKAAAQLTRKAYPHVIVTARKLSLERRIDEGGNGKHSPEESDLAKDQLLDMAKGSGACRALRAVPELRFPRNGPAIACRTSTTTT